MENNESKSVVTWCVDSMRTLGAICFVGIGALCVICATAGFAWNVLQASIFGAFLPAIK